MTRSYTVNEPTNQELAQGLDVRAAKLADLERYYRAMQPLAYLAPEARKALGSRFGVLGINFARLAVVSIAERLRLSGFTTPDGARDTAAWERWLRCDLDQLAPTVHREALALGEGHVIVWADNRGRARATVESSHQVSAYRDSGSGEVLGAIKRWEDLDPAGVARQTYYVVFRPDRIEHLVSDGSSITAAKTVRVVDNPLEVCPVVPFVNADRVLDVHGVSEIEDLIPLLDALNKVVADMLVASEFYARPRRWATGIELSEEPVLDDNGQPVTEDGEVVTEAANPYPEGDRMMIAEAAEAKFGQLAGADLAPYREAVDILAEQIRAVSALPPHYTGTVTGNPSSADGIRAAEASLTARAEAKQATFGRSWEQVTRLMAAIDTGTEVADHHPRVVWADPATRSVAQEADAVTKMHAEGLLTTEEARERLGITNPAAGPTPAPIENTNVTEDAA